jgi:hypothetical protein
MATFGASTSSVLNLPAELIAAKWVTSQVSSSTHSRTTIYKLWEKFETEFSAECNYETIERWIQLSPQLEYHTQQNRDVVVRLVGTRRPNSPNLDVYSESDSDDDRYSTGSQYSDSPWYDWPNPEA